MDVQRLRDAVRHFAFYSTPSNGNSSSPCTVDELKRVISNMEKLLNVFVDELEKEEH